MRNIALDYLKISLALMVVGLHTGFLGDYSPLLQYLTVNGLFRIAVPIFCIINGFYFYNTLSNNKQIFWLKRFAILYFVWMVFYSYFWFSKTFSISLFIPVLTGYWHLWYVIGVIYAAILLLILHNKSFVFLSSSALITFSLGILIQYFGNYHTFGWEFLDKICNLTFFHRSFLFLSYPFFCIGFLINKYSLLDFLSLKMAITLSILGIFILLGEAYFNYHNSNRDGGIDNYISLLIACPSIFIYFSKLNISSNSKNIALYSSGIYFIHIILLKIIHKFMHFKTTTLTITTIFTSLFISYFLIELNKKIKFIL